MRKTACLSLPGAICAMACAGCDPVVNIAGANFPAWLLCAIVGGLIAGAFRHAFVALHLEPYMWPLPIVYSGLAVLAACVIYLMFFRS